MKLADKYQVEASLTVNLSVDVHVNVDGIPSDWYTWDPETGTIVLTATGKTALMDEATDSFSGSMFYEYDIVDVQAPSWADGTFIITDEDGDEIPVNEVEPF